MPDKQRVLDVWLNKNKDAAFISMSSSLGDDRLTASGARELAAELIAAARAQPGRLSYGSYGNGTSAHLAGELFKSLAKIDITHVPYKGSSPAITDLLGGQIDMMLTTVASVS